MCGASSNGRFSRSLACGILLIELVLHDRDKGDLFCVCATVARLGNNFFFYFEAICTLGGGSDRVLTDGYVKPLEPRVRMEQMHLYCLIRDSHSLSTNAFSLRRRRSFQLFCPNQTQKRKKNQVRIRSIFYSNFSQTRGLF